MFWTLNSKQFLPTLLNVSTTLFTLTQNHDGGAGLQLGVGALHHIDSWVGHSDRGQCESSSGDVDWRSACVAGENCLLVAHPGEDEGLS